MRIKSSRHHRKGTSGLNLPVALLIIWLGFFGICWIGWIGWQVSFPSAVTAVVPKSQRAILPLVLLTAPERGTLAFTDVRGNLGPASVVLENRTDDWLHDRWQAASNMHGKEIRGAHWVHIVLAGRSVRVKHFLLDWETAYADDYRLEGWYHNQSVVAYFDSQLPEHQALRVSQSLGQSPGVKQKLPLHVIHEIDCPVAATTVQVDELRLTIRRSFHTGWGVSLWRFQAFGYEAN